MIQILFIETDTHLLAVGKRFLEQKGDFDITTLTSALSALEVLKSRRFDVLISDYQMTDMDGIEFIKEVRTYHGRIPIIMVTGSGKEEGQIDTLNHAAVYYIRKDSEISSFYTDLSKKIQYAISRHHTEETRVDQEQLYQLIHDSTPDFIYGYDTNGRFTYANRSLCTSLNLDIHQILGKTHAELGFPTAICQEWNNLHLKVYETGTTITTISKTQMPDGGIHEYEVILHPVRDISSSITGIVGISRDITRDNQTDQELQKKNQILATINQIAVEFASLPKGKLVSELAIKKLMELSGVVQAMFSLYDPSDQALHVLDFEIAPGMVEKTLRVLGKRPDNIIIPVTRETYDEIVSTIVSSKKTLSEMSYGHIPWFISMSLQKVMGIDHFIGIAYVIEGELYGTSLLGIKHGFPDPPNELLESLAHIIAVSLRRSRAELSLHESEEWNRSFLEQMLEGAIILDDVGRVIEWNPAQERMTGILRNEAVGVNFRDLATRMIPDPDRCTEICLTIQDAMRLPLQPGNISHPEMVNYHFLRADGTMGIANQTTFTIKTLRHHMLGILNQDITDHRLAEERIQDSELSYRGIFNTIRQAIYILNQDGQFIDVNNGAEVMYGYTREEFIGKTPEFISAPGKNDSSAVARYIRSAFEIEPQVFEFWGMRKNKEIFPKDVRLYKGTFFGEDVIIAIGTDITMRKHMEEALLSKTTLFEAQAESTLDGILVVNEQNERIFINRHLIDMWDIPTDILEDPSDEVLLQYIVRQTKNPELFYQKVLDLYAHPQEASRDVIEFLNGRVYDRYSAPVIDRFGRYHGRIWTFRDLTDYQRMEDSLRSRTALFEAQAIAHLGNWEWNLTENRIFISDELCRIFGIDPASANVTYQDLIQKISPVDQELIRSSIQALITAGTSFIIDFNIIHPNGAERIARGIGEAEWNSEGNLHRVSWIVHDITDLKRLEEDLKDLIQEKEMLLKEIHHRVKNNMQVISSLISIQFRQVSDPSLQDVLKDIQSRVRSFGLVHELLYKSPKLNEIDYQEYLSKITRFLLDSYSISQESVTCTIQADLIRLDIEKAIPCSLILNELITNSLKYAFPNGRKGEIRISITVDPASSWYYIDYQDNGVGFASEIELDKNSGLGTTLMQGLTRQLSGTITIDERNTGAHYRISFPSGSS